MTDHPITPPPELFRQWEGMPRSLAFEAAYRAGADDELEACCEWLENQPEWMEDLRAARRPKPPSLAEQALEALEEEDDLMPLRSLERGERFALIRRALERLEELENND